MLTQPQKGNEKVQLPALAQGTQTPLVLVEETARAFHQVNLGLPGGSYANLEMGVPTPTQRGLNAEEQLSTV